MAEVRMTREQIDAVIAKGISEFTVGIPLDVLVKDLRKVLGEHGLLISEAPKGYVGSPYGEESRLEENAERCEAEAVRFSQKGDREKARLRLRQADEWRARLTKWRAKHP